MLFLQHHKSIQSTLVPLESTQHSTPVDSIWLYRPKKSINRYESPSNCKANKQTEMVSPPTDEFAKRKKKEDDKLTTLYFYLYLPKRNLPCL